MLAIYALIDPRDMKEFYIGRTENVNRRFRQHLACADRNDAKNKQIKELQSLFLVPIMKTLEVVEDAALAGQREAYWIRHFRYLGHSLSNDTVFDITEEEETTQPQKQTTKNVNGNAAKRVHRILKRNPNIRVKDLALKAGVSRSYASELRMKLQPKESA